MAQGGHGRRARHRPGHRRRGLGRQLVLPGRRSTARIIVAGERRRADRLRLARPPGAERAGLTRTSITSSCSARPSRAGANSRNFVLCPGKAYDRSPCGTGTSAKLACLAADGKLAEGAGVGAGEHPRQHVHRQRSAGSIGRPGSIEPAITGRAFVNAEARLLLNDPGSVRARHPLDEPDASPSSAPASSACATGVLLRAPRLRVTLVERNAAQRDGCSFGNAGMVVPSHFVPLAAPGMVALGLKWMWNPESPFYIKPRLSRDLLDWGSSSGARPRPSMCAARRRCCAISASPAAAASRNSPAPPGSTTSASSEKAAC